MVLLAATLSALQFKALYLLVRADQSLEKSRLLVLYCFTVAVLPHLAFAGPWAHLAFSFPILDRHQK